MGNFNSSVECTVVMPCYNARQYIGNSIESVRHQTFDSWELIIVDDASTDGSADFIEENYVNVDPRIRLERLEANSGAAVARNVAIEKGKGRFIAFLDSDDTWAENKLERQLAFMKEHDYAFTYTGYRKFNEGGEFLNHVGVPESVSYSDLLKTNVIGCLTAVYDAGQLGKVYMPLIRKRQDFGLWLKLLKMTPRAYGINHGLASYTVRQNSISANKHDAALHTWRLYRNVERLPFSKSVYYFLHYIVRGFLRTRYPAAAQRLGMLK